LTRILRLLRFGLLALAATYLAVNAALGWVYVYVLTHPACPAIPTPDLDLPAPEEHQITTSDGETLRAWYYPSENGAAVLALGGLQGALGANLPPVAFLVAHGYGVLQIDSRMCGKPPRAVTLGFAEVQDAAAGLAFLMQRPEVNPARIAATGFSMGAVSAIRAAARHQEIAAVVAEGGYHNLGSDILESGHPTSLFHQVLLHGVAGAYWLQIGENPWRVSPISDLSQISPRAVLLIYGEHELNGARAEQQYQAAREPKELWIVPGGKHGGNYAIAKEEYEQRVLAFLEKNLR
jgi:dipeptidyl aminopeptidase/acylaminoacyl peptidase